jgi:hypothetical protein
LQVCLASKTSHFLQNRYVTLVAIVCEKITFPQKFFGLTLLNP